MRLVAKEITLMLAGLALSTAYGCHRAGGVPKELYLDVDAGGHRLHMLVVGEAGPTVVLETGWPGCGIGWNRVRGPVGRFARVVTYDRAGTGKSESGPLPRHADQIAKELHTALLNAGLHPPYILVGQSWGGTLYPGLRETVSRRRVWHGPRRSHTTRSLRAG